MKQIAADLSGPWGVQERRTNWAVAFLFRAPSVPLVWLLARLGVRPIAITVAALFVALAEPLLVLCLPLGTAAVCLFLAGVVYQILDCADGTLARITGQTSDFGGDMDFLVDMTQWGLLYLSIGMLADATLQTGWQWTALAGLAAWGRLLTRVIRDRLRGDAPETDKGPLRGWDWPVAFVDGLSGLIPFLALAGQRLDIAVMALMVYSLIDIGDSLRPVFAARRA